MADEELKALQERLRSVLGREVPLEQVARNKQRFERFLTVSQFISDWESQLDLVEPATVTSLLKGRTS